MATSETSDTELMTLVRVIAAGNSALALQVLQAQPELARARLLRTGATRQTATQFFLDEIGHYVCEGDTALHMAAAAYQGRDCARIDRPRR